jgi:hypothetical protein
LQAVAWAVIALLRAALGDPQQGSLLADLAQAIAFCVIATGALAYHGGILRGEGRRRQSDEATRAAELRVAVLDLADGSFGRGRATTPRATRPRPAADWPDPCGGDRDGRDRRPARPTRPDC